MAWTTPKTWADGDIPDADDLNTHIKANLDALSAHTHSGAAGDGSAALAPITTVTFVNQGSTPAAPGSTKVNIFSESETLKVREGASGAAVAISLAGHTHIIEDKQQGEQQRIESNRSALEAALDADEGGGNPTSYGTIPNKSHTMTPTAGSSVVISGFNVFWGQDSDGNGTGEVTGYVKLTRAGSQVKETSNQVTSSTTNYYFAGGVQSTFVDENEAASSTAYGASFKVTRNGGDGSHCAGSGVTAVEVGF